MDKETMRLLERGREYYENREYDKAQAYLLKVLEINDGFADVLNMLGVIYHDKGQIALAQEYFEKAMRVNPKYTEAALNLAVTYNEQGRYAQAKQIYSHVTKLSSGKKKEIEPYARGKLANMHADLGRAYAELQMLDQAVIQYRQALLLCPGFVDIRTRLGQLLRDGGDLETACEEFERVKVERPNYLPARISLGVTYFALKDRELAKKEWESVIEIDPDNKTAQMYLKMVQQLLAQEEAEEAGMHLEVEAPKPSDAEAAEASSAGELDFDFNGEQSSVERVSIPSEPLEAGQSSAEEERNESADSQGESDKKD